MDAAIEPAQGSDMHPVQVLEALMGGPLCVWLTYQGQQLCGLYFQEAAAHVWPTLSLSQVCSLRMAKTWL